MLGEDGYDCGRVSVSWRDQVYEHSGAVSSYEALSS